MLVWFTMIAVLGLCALIWMISSIFRAFNPYYAINFLVNYKGAFVLLVRYFCALPAPKPYTATWAIAAEAISGYHGSM